ncbi:hypothetical protein C8J56DRAFT_898666 [Mycena floridula]|nr:hypothetical protein C8J56DRAFT_898666 [Mycena floridula]
MIDGRRKVDIPLKRAPPIHIQILILYVLHILDHIPIPHDLPILHDPHILDLQHTEQSRTGFVLDLVEVEALPGSVGDSEVLDDERHDGLELYQRCEVLGWAGVHKISGVHSPYSTILGYQFIRVAFFLIPTTASQNGSKPNRKDSRKYIVVIAAYLNLLKPCRKIENWTWKNLGCNAVHWPMLGVTCFRFVQFMKMDLEQFEE